MTKEQIARAKEWDLLSYLQTYEPQELHKCGGREYSTVTHDSLRISNGRWNWHSWGIGGKTALDYLVRVRGMDFVSAVETLCRERGADAQTASEIPLKEKPAKPFLLPPENRCGTAAVSYLLGRGIDAEVISRCIGKGLLYESRDYHNCVFVGKDSAGKARYAFLRGIYGAFKKDVDGSDKRYSFSFPSSDKDSPFVAVAESPVDALSVASLLKMQGEDWTKNHYLSLGGTAPCALLTFLHDHPAVSCISLCLDNDGAGILGMEKIREAVREDAELSRRIRVIANNPPPLVCGKDYNELLQQKVAERYEAESREKVRTGHTSGMEK